MGKPVIDLKGLTKVYGETRVVDNLNLQIERGEIFGLLGPNGAGKTTTILMMLGLTEPNEGQALVCSVDATRNPIEVKKKVGYLPDSVGFYDDLTALQNLEYIGRLNGLSGEGVESTAKNMMELVGLEDDMYKKTSAYSRGMKQRLGLADVLIKEPEIIVLDEPTLGIDPSGIKEFLTLIRRLSREQGLTVLISSHQLHQVQQICDRVGIFVKGKLLVQGNIEKLSRNLFGKESYVTLVDVKENLASAGGLRDELQSIPDVISIRIDNHTVEFSCNEDITPTLVRLMVSKGLNITGVRKKEFGLDEIYHRYFESSQNKSDHKRNLEGLIRKTFLRRSTSEQ